MPGGGTLGELFSPRSEAVCTVVVMSDFSAGSISRWSQIRTAAYPIPSFFLTSARAYLVDANLVYITIYRTVNEDERLGF